MVWNVITYIDVSNVFPDCVPLSGIVLVNEDTLLETYVQYRVSKKTSNNTSNLKC